MRILVEPSDYVLRNAGDAAMLHVAVTRLSELWPDASIQVFSDAPENLPQYSPHSRPLSGAGRRSWLSENVLQHTMLSRVVSLDASRASRFERTLRRRFPEMLTFIRQRHGLLTEDVDEFLTAVTEADLLIVAGMGGITDAFPEYAHGVLETLSLAQQNGVATVMVGQGLGPITSADLWARTGEVFRRLDFVALREGYAGVPLLRRLSVAPDRIIVTGDDAIEVAFRAKRDTLGHGLGVNLRAATYSEIGAEAVEGVGEVVRQCAATYCAQIVPVPISWVPGEEDIVTITRMVAAYEDVASTKAAGSWPDVIAQVALCRILVTGSYHAGVFALAQGVPTLCIARSHYYVDKFVGLSDQFGEGCVTILIGEPGATVKLGEAIRRMWAGAEALRGGLLARASKQIELGHTAYERIRERVNSHSKRRGSLRRRLRLR